MSTHHTITATYPSGHYPILIGEDLLNDSTLLTPYIQGTQVLIVSNETVAPLYIKKIKCTLKNYQCDDIILPDGEQHKTLSQWQKILDTLIEQQHHRDTTLIALGGGVIGDITGFAAACFQRGVAFIQIPTTLLAQVDASIGGKTAVNHTRGKNLIGAFHQPAAVLIDINTLKTLNDREYKAGIAEIIKAALIKDANFFQWLEDNITALIQQQPKVITEALIRAITIKRDIVAEDEKEKGIRALLNLGHTFGHAIEHNLGYGTWLHGEAVAMGIRLAGELSVELGKFNPHELTRVVSLFSQIPLPQQLPSSLQYEHMLAAIQSDKKIFKNQINMILLQAIGQATIDSTMSQQQLADFFLRIRSNIA